MLNLILDSIDPSVTEVQTTQDMNTPQTNKAAATPDPLSISRFVKKSGTNANLTASNDYGSLIGRQNDYNKSNFKFNNLMICT